MPRSIREQLWKDIFQPQATNNHWILNMAASVVLLWLAGLGASSGDCEDLGICYEVDHGTAVLPRLVMVTREYVICDDRTSGSSGEHDS
jgi:hypothetical protein